MLERNRPTDLPEALDIARIVTDDRTDFDVYLDVARRLVKSRLSNQLSELAISEAHKKEIIEAEAYAMAQPAHLHDASVYEPIVLATMLDGIGVLKDLSE